jgi:hypothetical protein
MIQIEGPSTQQETELPEDHWNRLYTDEAYFGEFADRPALQLAAETTAFPDAYLKRQANIAYMASVYKTTPEEMEGVYDFKKEEIARAELRKASLSDEGLFEHFKAKFDNINQRNSAGRTLLENVARRTVEDLYNDRQSDSKKPLEDEMSAMSDVLTPEDMVEIRKRSDEITRSLRSAAPEVIKDAQWLFQKMGVDTGILRDEARNIESTFNPAMVVGGLSPAPQAFGGITPPDPANVQEAIDRFADLPDERRQAVYNMASAFATLYKADKGVMHQLVETMGRMASGTVKSTKGVTAETSLRMEFDRIESGQPVLLDSRTGAMVAPVSEGYTGMNFAVPTPEQKQARIDDIRKQLKRIKVERELRNLAETRIDPIQYASTFLPNWVEEGLYGAASSVSYSAMAAIPIVGLPATALALYAQQYEEFMLEDPEMDPQKAMLMAAIAAPIRAFTERIQFLAAFGKALPFTSGLFKRFVKPQQNWLTRTMIIGAAGYTEQNVQELIEGAITPVVQTVFAALDEDTKGFDWKEKVAGLPREIGVNAVATMPLSLIGLGAIGYNEVKFGERYLYDKAIMERMGFSAEAADRVASERDPETAQKVFREEFAKRDPAAVNAATMKIVNDMVEAGNLESAIAMPTIEKQGEDYVVRKWNGEEVARTTDGEAAGYELQQLLVSQEQANWEALNMMVTALRKVKEDRGISDQSIIELVDEGTLDAAANMTPEQLKLRLDALEKEMGVSLQPDQIRTVGLNIGELRDGIFRDVSRIVRSDDPDMVNVVIEETIEGDLKRAWNQNLFSKTQTVEWVRQYEQASGENLLADNFDALNEADQTSNLTEAMSTLGVAYFNGNIDRASIPQRLAQFFQRLLVYLQHIMARAVKLQAGLESGQIDARLEQFFAESLGIPIDTVIDSQTRQAQTEILDTETTAAIRPDDTRLRGININDSEQDFTGQILRGEKTIETREAPTLSPYIGRRVALVSTGKGGTPSIVGYAVVGEPKVYNTVDEFRADYDQHRVEPNSTFDIKPDGIKYGYPLTEVQAVEPTPVNVPVGRIATILDNATAAIRPVTQQQDADYLAAVERGDMETAQRMVTEAAQQSGFADSNYRMMHSAPDRTSTALASVKSSNLVPDDYWTKPQWYQNTPEEFEAFFIVRGALDRAEKYTSEGKDGTSVAKIQVYRAVPKTVKEESIRNGDWVTPSRRYAEMEGKSIPDGYRIISQRAKLKNLWWDGNSIAELGFDDGQNYAYKNTKNNRKLLDPVTRDEDGNIIPLSQRFNPRRSEITYAIRPTSEMLEQMAAPASETGVEIPDTVDKAALLENLFNIAQGQSWQRGRDLKQAMQQALLDEFKKAGVTVPIPSKEVAESPEATTYLVRVGLRDALLALRQNSNAIGWYDVKTRQALAVMALIHPEIERDENARFAMTWAMAVTSNGLKVGKNFELAEQVYSSFKANGVMPTDIGIGQAAGAINEGLGLFNTLRAEWGADNLRQFMQTRFTVQEISGLSPDLTPSGEHAATMVRGSAILGPKIGNGFFSNLYGYFDALTMDRWLVRTWGRWTGTLIVRDEARIVSGRTTLRAALQKTDVAKLAEGLRSLKKVTKTKGETELKPKDRERLIAAMEGLTESDDSVDELANAIQKASMDKQFREVMNSVEGGSDLRKTGNNLAKEIDGQKEAPDGPHERNYIRHVFGQILAELKAMPEYAELTMADLQAVLWYAEKRLYETAKEDEDTDSNVEGYEDDEAPDYANAAAGVARAKGVPERKIKKALNDELTATTRPESQSQAAGQGEQGKVGGFAPTEKKLFASAVGVRRIRLGRRTSEAQSYSYNRGSERDGKGARVLKNLGVSYVSEWKAGPAFRRILKANSPDAVSKGQDVAPLFYELEQTPQNAARFAELITASKTGNRFGAAVYVYPANDYAQMQLFVTKDGLSGVAVKPDGDIVSVFSTGGAGRAIMELAVAAGGTKLDAFDTILPDFYSAHGFVAVSRLKWDDSQAPDGWDKTVFGKFNNGEPDVVFMAHNPNGHAWYSEKDGKVFTDYGKAVKAQEKAVGEFQKQAQIVTAAVRPATGDTLRDRLAQMDGDPKFRRERVAAALKKFKSIRDRFSQKRPDDPLSQIEAVAYLEALISMLPPEARKNIGGAEKLAGYKTARGRMNYLLKRIERTDKALEAYLRGAYIEEINELVENLSDTTDKNRTNRSRIGPEAQRIVNYIASVIDLEQKDVANKITGIQAQMNDPEATPEMLAQLQEEWALLDRYGALASADQHSAESLAQSYESLRSVILRGRDQWKAQEKLRLEEYERIRNEAQTELNQNVPTGALPSQLQKSKEESVTWWSKAQNYLEGHLAWYQHLRKIFGEGKLANQYETRVRRATNAFEDAQIQAKNNFRLVMIQRMGIGDKINLKTMAALNDALQKLNETRQSKAVIYEGKQVKVERIPMQTAIAAIFENKGNALGFDREELFRLNAELSAIPAGNIARRKFIELERVVANGVPREQRLSELEAIQDILMWSQDDVRVKMERQGYTQDYIDSLSQDFLSNNGQIMLDYLRSQYSQGYDRVNAVYRRIYGMDMPRVRNYAPTAYDTAQTDAVMGPDEMSPSLTGMNAGFVKQRVSHNAPILRMNALSVFQSHMVTQNYWINFAELVRELRGTIASTDVVRAIKARVGEADAERMKKWILAFDRNGLDSGKMLEVVSDMLNRQMGLQAVMFMGYALSTLFKQGSAGMAISLDIGVDEYLRGLTKFFRGQLSASLPEIWNSPTIQRRIEAGYSPEARAVNQSAGMSPSKLLALAERGMLNIAQLDAFLTTFGAAIAFDHHYNAALAQGLSKEAAKSIALDRMDASVRRTAQPASLTDRSLLEANRSPFVRLLYLFASEPRQKFAINYMIAREIAAGRDVKRNLKKFAAGWVAMGVITEALTDIFQSIFRDDDEQEIVRWEDYARAAVMGHLNGLFLAGPALAMAGNAIFGSPVFNSSENPLVRIPTLVMRKDFKPWNWEDASDVVKGIQSYAQLTATVTGSMAVASVAAMLNIAKDAAGLWDKMTKDEE